jgi:hypothetical protein
MKKLPWLSVLILEALSEIDPQQEGMTVAMLREALPQRTNMGMISAADELLALELIKERGTIGERRYFLIDSERGLALVQEQRELRKLENLRRQGKLRFRPQRRRRESGLAERSAP